MAQEQPANFACPNYPFCAIEAIAPAAAVPAAYQPHMDLYWAQRQALYQPVIDYSLPGMDQWYAAQAAVSISCISFISILIHNLVLQLQKGSSNIFHFIAARSTNGITPRKCHPPSSNCPSWARTSSTYCLRCPRILNQLDNFVLVWGKPFTK